MTEKQWVNAEQTALANHKLVYKALPKELKSVFNSVCKHHYKNGVRDAFGLVEQAISVPHNDIVSYGVYHDDSIDGG
jgi:hypothetical protein